MLIYFFLSTMSCNVYFYWLVPAVCASSSSVLRVLVARLNARVSNCIWTVFFGWTSWRVQPVRIITTQIIFQYFWLRSLTIPFVFCHCGRSDDGRPPRELLSFWPLGQCPVKTRKIDLYQCVCGFKDIASIQCRKQPQTTAIWGFQENPDEQTWEDTFATDSISRLLTRRGLTVPISGDLFMERCTMTDTKHGIHSEVIVILATSAAVLTWPIRLPLWSCLDKSSEPSW